MHLATVAFLTGGSLLGAATLAASDSAQLELGSSSVSPASIPEAITSQNIRDAAPATARFTAQNGYTGDLTLLTPMRGQSKPQTGIRTMPPEVEPGAKAPAELLRFDHQLPQNRVAVPLLEISQRPSVPPVIFFVPSAGDK